MAIKYIVTTEEEKQQLLEASEHIHDSDVDTDIPFVNTIAHLYHAPWLIEVDPTLTLEEAHKNMPVDN